MAADEGAGFGASLRRLRLERGLSQDRLAELAGLTAAAVGALERGERRHPYPNTVGALAAALGLSPAERATLAATVTSRSRPSTSPTAGPAAPRVAPPAIPIPATALFGRATETEAVLRYLATPAGRLATITGPGGVGKTRVALEVAHRIANDPGGPRVAWIDLFPVADHAQMVDAMVAALGLATGPNPGEVLAAFLAETAVLFVLDNMEHLLDAAPVVGAILARTPGGRILATSRAPLHLRGEHVFPLRPLGLAGTAVGNAPGVPTAEAARFLLERAQAAGAELPLIELHAGAISEICERLDGLPLALELAAAQLRHRSPAEVAAELAATGGNAWQGFRDAPARHRSLDEAIAWSCASLPESGAVLLRRLGVFAGPVPPGDVVAVCGMDDGAGLPGPAVLPALALLRDRSLVEVRAGDGAGRVSMLETIRRFSLERLRGAGEEERFRRRHAEHFTLVAEETAAAAMGPDRESWFARLDAVRGELRAAMEWATGGDHQSAARMAMSLAPYLASRGASQAEIEAVERTARTAEPGDDFRLRGGARFAACGAAWWSGDLPVAIERGEHAVADLRSAGDPGQLALALSMLGLVRTSSGRHDAAVRAHSEALDLFRRVENPWGTAYALANLGDALFEAGDLARARDCHEDALRRFEDMDDPWGQAIVLHWMGNLARREGDPERALGRYLDSVTLARSVGNTPEASRGLLGAAAAALALGRRSEAARFLIESLGGWQARGDRAGVALCLEGIGAVLAGGERPGDAAAAFAAAEHRAPPGAGVYALESGLFETYRRTALGALAPGEAEAALRRGRRLSLDAARALVADLATAGPGP